MEAFIPSYPDVEQETFYRDIVRKYEFAEEEEHGGLIQSDETLGRTTIHGMTEEDFTQRFFRYQTNIARFLSAKTLYQSLLIIHEMGTGKSGSAIATAYLVRQQDPTFKRVVVLANGKTQLNNFRQEVLLRLPSLYEKHPDTKDVRTILRREGFVFDTFRIFARHIQNKRKDELTRLYDRSIIIMDEIHNLTSSSASGAPSAGDTSLTNARVYSILYDFVHALPTRKLLCLTGTPIRDKPQEIATVLNLVIPVANRLPVGEDFRQKYLEARKTVNVLGDAALTVYAFRPDRVRDFTTRVRGYVSYLKKSLPQNITVEYVNNSKVSTQSFLDHFRVYADVMQEPQNTMYLEAFVQDLEATGGDVDEQQTSDVQEEAEPSSATTVPTLAYSRSKQVGLFAFPKRDLEYVRPIYEKKAGTSKAGRFMRSIGWTKDMRALFPKDVGIVQKFERIAQYSSIYAHIVQEIIDNPSQLVYIYSFLKSGAGVYVLASFLVEYFQFEIVRRKEDVRTKTTNRRRLLILNHDFMSDTDLREMVDAFNQDENVFGDYIQVVIGTKQTKEGITLKNIQQVHVVQPDWNYADISQAIARGIRVGSHTALLEKVPSVRVRVFQHASVPVVEEEVDLAYSIDMEQYRRSEIKDMNTKAVERRLLEASWDCELNRARNTGIIDGSRECEYTTCAYTCDGIPKSRSTSDEFTYDTFNQYYADMARRVALTNIRRRFRTSNVASADDLFAVQKNTILLDTVLSDTMMNGVQLHNARGDTSFLRYDRSNDVYFLVLEREAYSYYDGYYTQTPIFWMPMSFETTGQRLYTAQFSTIVNGLIQKFYEFPEHREEVRTVILQSPLVLQERLLETILRDQTENARTNPFYDFVRAHYESQARLDIRNDGQVFISSILPDAQRRLDIRVRPLTWTTVEAQTIPDSTSEDDIEFIRKYITENAYGYYGILEVSATKTVFKIRDVRDRALVFGSNKAKVPKGEVCAASFSRKKSGLIDILLTLKWRPASTDPSWKLSSTELLRAFEAKDKRKLLTDMGKTNAEQLPEDDLRAVYALSTEKIPQLCGRARTRFEELDLIHEKRV